MSQSDENEYGETLRYGPRDPEFVPPPSMSSPSLDEIDEHITKHIGAVDNVWHELLSEHVHVDVHVVNPTDDQPWYTLVTSGMSDLPMTTPDGVEGCQYAELVLRLPKTWKLSDEDFKDERNYWPIRWLKILARFPHVYSTWLWWGHTMPNGDPAEPLAEDCSFMGFMLAQPVTVPVDFWELEVSPTKTIAFLSPYPLYQEEMDLKLKKGAQHLMDRFERHKISEVVDIRRKNVGKAGWWPF